MSESGLVSRSSSKSWNYEVFLSFRGEDTRKTFVDHLYTSLVQQGIHTYKDDETLPRGESIGLSLLKAIRESRAAVIVFSENYADSSWCLDELAYIMECMTTRGQIVMPVFTYANSIHTYKDDETLPRGESIGLSLLKAIRESRAAVIVFSENYADSSWCLDELAYIMECMTTRGQIVMPVFYDVDPSDVRKQKGKYGEAFAKHELENNHKVELWKNALAAAGNLSGWVTKEYANGHEAKCVKDIVGSISSNKLPLISKVSKDFIGIESRLQDLKSKLETRLSGGVRIIGIWGVGGGGKTTLASAAYTEMSVHFEGRCFLDNIREESNKHGLKMLQKNMLLSILKTEVVVESEEEGRSMIKRRLCHKKVLVVLDDVDDLKQIEYLAGSHDWFGKGSRIIITTRNKHMLTRKADSIYAVSLLSHDEAMKLFHTHAYQEDNPVEDYEILSEKVVSYAGGLPLALEVLGKLLYDKDTDEWKSALAKLKDIPDHDVMKRLKISYDGLDPNQKDLFLDIACFHRNRTPIDDAIKVLDACSLNPVIDVRVLVQKSLIYESNGVFDMHDLIEEMAHHIVRGKDTNYPEKHSRVWKSEDILHICDMNTTTEHNKIEAIVMSEDIYPPRLPQVLANMKNARWISLENYPKSSFPTNFQPTKLGCLTLKCGLQKELWQGSKRLPNLKILDLRCLMNLQRTPDFNGLPCLERLDLHGCSQLKEIHPSIGHHEKLVYVNMTFCEKLKMFPPIIGMQKLETLNLDYCKRLWKFPEFKTNMDSLIELRLRGTAIEIVPSSVGEYCTNLVSLDLRYCENLKKIECNFRLFKHLKECYLHSCRQLEKLADNFFDVECCLEVLSLSTDVKSSLFNKIMIGSGLSYLYQIPVIIKFPMFPRFLKKLRLQGFNLGDGDIPLDIVELSCLQVLDLRSNKFSRLPSNLSQLPSLKFLNVSGCVNLVELPDLPSSIAILQADFCSSLKSLGDLSSYKWLWKVTCWNVKTWVVGDRVLHSMLQGNAIENHFLSLCYGAALSKMPHQPTFTLQLPHNWYNDFSGFLLCTDKYEYMYQPYLIVIKQEETLLDVQPDHWPEFDSNPECDEYFLVGYVSFGSLRHTSWWNSAYNKLSFELGDKFNLKVRLVPRKCNRDSNERAKGAVDSSEFWDEEVESDKKTFKIRLPNLKILDLRCLMNLQRTPDFNGLPCLERLDLHGCSQLKEIHPSIGHHEKLVYVNMTFCEKLKMFPPIIGMQKLETLNLDYCKRLWKFPEFKTNMDSLIELRLRGTAIEIVPSSVGEYCTNLVSLDLRYCENLKKIECNFRLFKHLKECYLHSCRQLEKLADNFFDVECCLEVLSLSTDVKSSLFNKIMIGSGLSYLYQIPVIIKFPMFPRFLKKLRLQGFNLGDGDIPLDIVELSCLQVLDLRSNKFSRLPSNLSQLPSLKFLNVSGCVNLVELPDLPSSIAILQADFCSSLKSLGDLSSYKWLWKVTCWNVKTWVVGDRVLHSMLQGNAIENHFLSLCYGAAFSKMPHQPTFTLQLPHNWYNDFSGFLLCTDKYEYMYQPYLIVIKQEETLLDVQPDHWPEFDSNPECDEYFLVGYVSFGSLRHTSWWNSAYNKLSFELGDKFNLKVRLVPRKCNRDSNERAKGAVDSSEFWDEEVESDKKTFKIVHDSKSSIMIQWCHR
ncbi:NB-ARC domains-containing protein [Artemisia annua]|uniref:NB-ARC domains-containing protein n=1 Tax=Artemisia annua TaxID=35608 RepID=A0A2U1KWJ1_ARTAN|nr:NB-ARC domains-containing protein [Artemisia annua]